MVNHPHRSKPWRMLTWSNGDGTGKLIERRYATRRSAVRAANALRVHHVVALVERALAKRKENEND